MPTSSSKRSTTTTTVSIQVEESNPLVDPVVVSFPSGVPASGKAPKFAWKPLNEKRPKNGRVIMGSDEACVYSSQNFGRGHDGRRTKLFVGIYDKQSNTLKLVPSAQRGTVYSLTQSVPTYTPHVDETHSTLSAAERHMALFDSFGSAKKRRVLKSQQENRVNVDMVIGAGETMKKALSQQQISESNKRAMQQQQEEAEEGETRTRLTAIEAAHEEARQKFLPHYDVNAKEPRMVYDAHEMAGDDAWEQLGRVTGACLHRANDDKTITNWVALITERHGSKRWFDCAMELLEKTIRPDSPHAKYQAKCAMYMNHLLKFHVQTSKRTNLRGSSEELEKFIHMPREALHRCLEQFATPYTNETTGRDGYAISKAGRDRLCVQILLLYVMAHPRCKVGNILPVVKDCQLEPTRASQLLRAAGCTVTKRGPHGWSAALTVPLTFPPAKSAARGKRR